MPGSVPSYTPEFRRDLANVKDLKLLWKVKLESQPREMHNLFSPPEQGNLEYAGFAG